MRKALAAVALSTVLVAGTSLLAFAGEAHVTVKAKDNKFRPKRIEIARGTEVEFVNRGQNTHTFTSNTGLFDRTLPPGEDFDRKFRQAGTFKYHCEIHAGMTGRLIVT